MPSTINADNGVVSGSSGVKTTADTSGVLALQSNGSTGVTLDTSLKVGIGNTTPDLALDVYGTAGVNGAANRVMVLQTNDTATAGYGGGIAFGGYYNGTTNRVNDFAGIQGFKENGTANDYAGALKFTTRVNGGSPTEQVRVTSAGRVGIGTTTPASKFVVANGSVEALEFNPTGGTAGGAYIQGYNRTSFVYTPVEIIASSFAVYPQGGASKVNVNFNGLGLGTGTPSSGIGITFPATQDPSSNANTLDDYEEGTWTPSYSGGLSGVTYGTVRNGFYTKIGNQVTVWFGIMTDGLTVTSSSLNISGLPFTARNNLGAFNTVNLCSAVRWVSSPPIVGEILINTATISLYSNFNLTGAGTDPTLVTTGNMATGSGNRNVIYGTATYTV
jgi:hypothetical protein